MMDWAVLGKIVLGAAFAATGVAVALVAVEGDTSTLPEPLRRELRAVDSTRKELRHDIDSLTCQHDTDDTIWRRVNRPVKRKSTAKRPKLDTMEIRVILPDSCSEEDFRHIQALLRGAGI